MTESELRTRLTALGFTVTDIEARNGLLFAYVANLSPKSLATLEGKFEKGQLRGKGEEVGGGANRAYLMFKGGGE